MSALATAKINAVSETIQSTALHTATAEPTTGDILDIAEVHPQSGYEVKYPIGQELIIPGGSRVGIICTNAVGAVTVNCRAKLICEE